MASAHCRGASPPLLASYAPPPIEGMEPERIRVLNERPIRPGAFVLYWMQQSQRAEHNPALEYAIGLANLQRLPLVVAFGLTETFPDATARAYAFMVEGLIETRAALRARGCGFVLRLGDPPDVALEVARTGAAAVVTDRGYLRIQREWRRRLATALDVALFEVEGDVVVPVETASDHEEFAARTLRPKLLRLRDRFLRPAPRLQPLAVTRAPMLAGEEPVDSATALRLIRTDSSVPPAPDFRGGRSAARALLRRFTNEHLAAYADERSDPAGAYASRLSPYLHFGQISPVEIARTVQAASAPVAAQEAFLEQLIVRRELSMNFTHFNDAYDCWDGLPTWARETLEAHAADPRAFVYDAEAWDEGRTHDPLWNDIQHRLRREGWLPNMQRMYWGKKILEWSASPREAFEIAMRLNHRYELDGRDPNGFAGVAWCFGKHDRPWPARPVFGTVRSMGDRKLRGLIKS